MYTPPVNHDEMMFHVTDKFIQEYELYCKEMERLEDINTDPDKDLCYEHYEAHKLLADIGLYYEGDAYCENDRTKYTLKEWIKVTAESEGGGVPVVRNILADGIRAGYIKDIWDDDIDEYHCYLTLD